MAFISCIFAPLQHETSQARETSDALAGDSGAGHGFEACGVTWRSSPACSRSCTTRDIAGTQGVRCTSRLQWGRRRFEAYGVTRRSSPASAHPCNTRHHRHARRQMNEQAAVGAERGFEAACGVTRPSSPACSPTCITRHHKHKRRQMNEPAPVGAGHGFEACGVTGRSSPASAHPCNARHRRHVRASDERARASGAGARVRGLWRHVAVIPCMFANLHHETLQARELSGEAGGASGAGHGFKACGVTWRAFPACSLACNTRHRRHTRRQMIEPAPAGAGRGFEACGVTRRSSPASSHTCNTRHRRHARASDDLAGASRSRAQVRGL